jgi:hypothetical protein
VATSFDPFRLDQKPTPLPVEGPLPPPIILVDENDDLDTTRPKWHRRLAIVVIVMFFGTSVLTMIRQIVQHGTQVTEQP